MYNNWGPFDFEKKIGSAEDKTEWSEFEAGKKMECCKGLATLNANTSKINAITKESTAYVCSTCKD